MFNLKKINDLRHETFQRIRELVSKISVQTEEFDNKLKQKADKQDVEDLRHETDQKFDKSNNQMEKRLIEFHKEIAKTYFDSLEKIFRFNREISLISNLAKQLDDKDFVNLKASLMQPFMELRWKQKKEDEGRKIEAAGEKIITERDNLHNKIIREEKEGKDVSKMKEQLKVFDWLLAEVRK